MKRKQATKIIRWFDNSLGGIKMMSSTRKGEMQVTAENMVIIAEEKGLYYAVALLYDSNRISEKDLKDYLDILKNTKGAIK